MSPDPNALIEPTARHRSRRLERFQREIAELKEHNARLRRDLEEAETNAEFLRRADRILAIPPPVDA